MKIIILQLLILVSIISCTQKSNKKATTNNLNYNAKAFSEKLFDINKVSLDFATQIEQSNIKFIDALVNDPYQYRDYRNDLNISAANIGIYVADAQYLKVYGFIEKANLSSKSAGKLLKLIKNYKLDISHSKIQSGYKTSDSVIFILNNALKDSVNGLTEFERKQYLFSLILGNFIEKNYFILSALNTNINYNETKVKDLLLLLKKHNDQLSKIFLLRNKFINTAYKNYLRNDLKKYNDYYLERSSTLIQWKNQAAPKLVVQNLLFKISEMRKYIIYADILIEDTTGHK